MDTLEERLKASGVRPTAMRLLVYRELCIAHHPVSLKEMEERLVTADRSTIFRTLELLLCHRLAHGVNDGSGTQKYEACHGHGACSPEDHHPHFRCVQCQRTFCLEDTHVPTVPLPEGFVALSVNHVISGLCPDCRKTIDKKR